MNPSRMWPVFNNISLSFLKTLNIPSEPIDKFNSPWELLDYLLEELQRKLIETKMGIKLSISENALIEGPVWIGNNVTIESFTSIKGPTFIDDDTYIGSNCLIRQSIIGKGNLIGFSTEIARSVIADKCKFHRNSFIDSLACNGILLGGWTGTANVRLDNKKIFGKERRGVIIGSNTVLGAKCETMPGTIIGSNCIIGPCKTIYEDIQDNTGHL